MYVRLLPLFRYATQRARVDYRPLLYISRLCAGWLLQVLTDVFSEILVGETYGVSRLETLL